MTRVASKPTPPSDPNASFDTPTAEIDARALAHALVNGASFKIAQCVGCFAWSHSNFRFLGGTWYRQSWTDPALAEIVRRPELLNLIRGCVTHLAVTSGIRMRRVDKDALVREVELVAREVPPFNLDKHDPYKFCKWRPGWGQPIGEPGVPLERPKLPEHTLARIAARNASGR